jgi:hypothetical protein
LNQTDYFARVSVTPGLEFGVNQLTVHTDFEPASIGGNKCHTFNLRFKILEQIVCQAYGPVCIVSNSTVGNLDFHHLNISSITKNYTASWIKPEHRFPCYAMDLLDADFVGEF